VVLGGRREGAADLRPYTKQASAASATARAAKARARAEDLAHVIEELRAAGAVSLRALAEGLNARGIPAARGGRWSAVQVARVVERDRSTECRRKTDTLRAGLQIEHQ
jgi:hypothetical protein